jgi:hypothetical protein
MSTKETFIALLQKHHIGQPQGYLDIAHDVLDSYRQALEQNEPHAKQTIALMDDASSALPDLNDM